MMSKKDKKMAALAALDGRIALACYIGDGVS